VQQRSRALGWTVDQAVFPLIAQRSRGTPRTALRLLQACRRVCRAEGETASPRINFGELANWRASTN
jgi:Holliday junction resolvasome RuvABC ATP-dependent DNA helicase subunit